jgi:hypothetical protein
MDSGALPFMVGVVRVSFSEFGKKYISASGGPRSRTQLPLQR